MTSDFPASARQTAWVPVAVGGAGGALTGVGQSLVVGSPSSILLLGILDGVVGIFLGAAIMGVDLVTAVAMRRAARTAAIGIPVALGISALVALLLTRGWLLWPALVTGTAASAAHLVTAHARDQRPTRPGVRSTAGDPHSPTRLLLLGILSGGGFLSLAASPLTVSLLREGIHYACNYGTTGEAAGAWMCADGIGYLLPGIALLATALLPALIGALIVFAAGARTIVIALGVLSFIPVSAVALMTAALTITRDDPLPVDQTWPGVWAVTVGPSAALAVLGTALLAGARHGTHPASRMLMIVGGVLMLAGVIVQPGLAFAIAASAAAIMASITAGPAVAGFGARSEPRSVSDDARL